MMKINYSRVKATAGGASAGVGVLASQPIAEAITNIIVWSLSSLGTVPADIQGAINTLIMALVVISVTYVGVFFSPPNETVKVSEPIPGSDVGRTTQRL